MKPRLITVIALLSSLAVLPGCALRPGQDTPPVEEPTLPPPEPVVYDEEVLADLLVAEVAVRRDAFAPALGYYADVARRTDSPVVRAQATRLAAYMEDAMLSREMAELWLASAPHSHEAREMAALAEISLGNPDAAAAHIDRLLADNPDQALGRLVAHARSLNQEESNQLLAAFSQLTEQYPRQGALWYARALHLHQQGLPERALEANEQALKLARDHEEALLLKARLLNELGRHDDALRHLRRVIRRHPEAHRPQILNVRLLLEHGRNDQAMRQIEALSKRYPDDPDLRYSLILHALDQGAYQQSRPALEELLADGYRPSEIHLQLARIAEHEEDYAGAIEHYLKVNRGDEALRANVHAARLYYQIDQPEAGAQLMAELRDRHPQHLPTLFAAEAEMRTSHADAEGAMALLNEALGELPNHHELLYARALAAERLDNLEQAEADLRRILEQRPEDPLALNALGYTLTDRTDRHEEAYDYIRRALEQQPDNPAIIDSMGWVLFRLDRAEEALEYLQQAWEMMPDGEVGAHVVEVLWSLGRKDEARRFWQEANQADPDNRHLDEVRQRLLEH